MANGEVPPPKISPQQTQQNLYNLLTTGTTGEIELTPEPEMPGAMTVERSPESRSAFEGRERVLRVHEKSDWQKKPPKPVAAPAGVTYRWQAELAPGTVPTAEEQAALEAYNAKALALQQAELEGQARAALVSAEAQDQLSYIAQNDANAMRHVLNTVMPRLRRANQDLDRDIDLASKLQVNPYNYMQRIGRAGRIASVLAVGVEQLASGAGNPNSVLLRLENAVNRDVADQKDRIAQYWAGIEAKRQLTADELNLIEEQFSFEDKARAVAYAAAEARIGAAMQHMNGELAYQAANMVKDEAAARKAVHAAEARRKDGIILADGYIANTAEGVRRTAQMRATREQLERQALAQQPATAQELQAAQAPAEVPPAAAPQYAGAIPPEAPTAAPAPAPLPGPARRGVRKAPGAPVTPVQPPTAPGAPAPPAEAPTAPPEALAAEPAAAAPAPAPKEEPRNQYGATQAEMEQWAEGRGIPQNIVLNIRDSVRDDVIASGSHARFYAERHGAKPEAGGATLANMLAQLAKRPPNIQLAENYEDAVQLAKAYPPPNPKMYDTQSKDPRRADAQKIAYNQAVEKWKYLRRTPEAFMKTVEEIYTEAGRRTNIQVNDLHDPYLGTYRLLARSGMTLGTPQALKDRQDFEKKLANRGASAKSLLNAAKTIGRTGIGSFLGLAITEDGWTFKPLDAEAMFDKAMLEKLFTEGGIEAIKTADPSGRLTDKDIEVGKLMVAAFQSGGSEAKWDMLASTVSNILGEDVTQSEVRVAAARFLAVAAQHIMEAYAPDLSPHVLLTHEADQLRQKDSQEMYRLMREFDEKGKKEGAISKAGTKISKPIERGLAKGAEAVAPFVPGAQQILGGVKIGKDIIGALKTQSERIPMTATTPGLPPPPEK